jgi:hypothetical protein
MLRRTIVLVAVLGLLAAGAPAAFGEDPPVPDFVTGDLYARGGGWLAAYDVTDPLDPVVIDEWNSPTFTWGSGLAFDREGYMYLPVHHPTPGLMIFDKDPSTWVVTPHYATPLGFAPVTGGVDGAPHSVVLRHDGTQAIGCGTYHGRLYVFDTTDVANPQFVRSVDLGMYDGFNCALAYDSDGSLWVSAYGILYELEIDADGEIVSWVKHTGFGLNPGQFAFEPGTHHLYFSVVNGDAVSIRDPAAMGTEIARITDVCTEPIHNPLGIAFDSLGNLFVGCSGYDLSPHMAVIEGDALVGLTGTVTREALGGVLITNHPAGSLAFRPAGTPDALTEMLLDDLADLGLADGTYTALGAKLDAAMQILTDGDPDNDHRAIPILEAFIHQVEALAGKKIPADDAAALVDAAERIIAVILS